MLGAGRISPLRQIDHLLFMDLLGIPEKAAQRTGKRMLVSEGDGRHVKRYADAVAQVYKTSFNRVFTVDQLDRIKIEPNRIAVLR